MSDDRSGFRGWAIEAPVPVETPQGPPPPDFYAALSRAPFLVLATDYDGTLAPFRVERDAAQPAPGIRDALAQVRAHPRTRLVVVSGRVAGEVAALLALDPAPEIWGSHGWERLGEDGRLESWEPPIENRTGLEEALVAARREGLATRCEPKPGSLALHWRGMEPEEMEEVRRWAHTTFERLATRHGLQCRPFDGGLELRAPGRDKGAVVREIRQRAAADAFIVYLGDDLTDEDAFREVAKGGYGILVRPESRPSHARAWFRSHAELLRFLRAWARTGTES